MRRELADEAPHVCHKAIHTITRTRTRTRTSPAVGPLRGSGLYFNLPSRSNNILSFCLNRFLFDGYHGFLSDGTSLRDLFTRTMIRTSVVAKLGFTHPSVVG